MMIDPEIGADGQTGMDVFRAISAMVRDAKAPLTLTVPAEQAPCLALSTDWRITVREALLRMTYINRIEVSG